MLAGALDPQFNRQNRTLTAAAFPPPRDNDRR
jgi:hypothetical protein